MCSLIVLLTEINEIDIGTHGIKRMDFTPTKFSRLSVLCVKNQVNLIETLMIRIVSCPCNSECIKTKL